MIATQALRTDAGSLWRVALKHPERTDDSVKGSPVLNDKNELIGIFVIPSARSERFGIPSLEPASVDVVPLSEIRSCLGMDPLP